MFLVAQRPVLKLSRLKAEVAVAMRSSGGLGDLGPDCEFTVILLFWVLEDMVVGVLVALLLAIWEWCW